MNDVVTVIERGDSSVGDGCISRSFTGSSGFVDFYWSPGYFEAVRAALSITSATSLGCDINTQWLAPGTSTT
jgi:hypothetical protein